MYEDLDQGGKAMHTRKLNNLAKERGKLVQNIEGAKKRNQMTKSLLGGQEDENGSTETDTALRINPRARALPPFRGGKDSIEEAHEFIEKCKAVFEADLLPVARWLPALLTALTTDDWE